MKKQQFGEILNRYLLVYFPDTRDWVSALPDDTKSAWAQQFAQVEPRDLRAAIELLVSGREEFPRREMLALRLRQSAGRLAHERALREQSRESSAEFRRLRAQPRGADTQQAMFSTMERAGAGEVWRLITRTIERLRGTLDANNPALGVMHGPHLAAQVSAVISEWAYVQGASREMLEEMAAALTAEQAEELAAQFQEVDS